MRVPIIKVLFILFLLTCFLLGLYLYSAKDMKSLFTQMLFIEQTRENRQEGFGLFETYIPSPHSIEQIEDQQSGAHGPAPAPSAPATEEVPDCPNLLVKRGTQYFLYRSDIPEKEGENPVVFQQLSEYQTYLDAAAAQGKHCPVLFVQQENNAQGQDVYRVRETPVVADQQPGVPNELGQTYQQRAKYSDASRLNPPYNKDLYAGFDPTGLYVGKLTELDDIAQREEKQEISDNPMDPNWGGVLYTQQSVDQGKYKDNEVTKPRYFTPKTTFLPMLNTNMPKVPDPLDNDPFGFNEIQDQ